jgi:hypothetical protein
MVAIVESPVGARIPRPQPDPRPKPIAPIAPNQPDRPIKNPPGDVGWSALGD